MYGAKYSYAANIEKLFPLHNSVSCSELIDFPSRDPSPGLQAAVFLL